LEQATLTTPRDHLFPLNQIYLLSFSLQNLFNLTFAKGGMDMNFFWGILVGIIISISLVGVYFFIQKKKEIETKKTAEKLLKDAQQKAKEIIGKAENEAKLKLQQAEIQIKEELLTHKQALEKEFEKRMKEVSLKEERILHKEENLIKKEEA